MVRKLTVVQMLPALDGGGVERGTLEMAQALVEAGHRSIVISAGGRLVPELTAAGSEHIAWPIGRKSLFTLRFVPKLKRLLAEECVDILHVRSRVPAWVAWLAWRLMDSAQRPRFVTTVHGLYSVGAYSRIMTRGERVIAVSQTVRDYILKNYRCVDPDLIRVIPRGVDPAQFPYGKKPPADWLARWHHDFPQLMGKRVLVLPGRLTRLKGHHDFISLIADLKKRGMPVHGLIVGGEDPRRPAYARELIERVDREGLAEDVTLVGHRADMREIYGACDLVLSLSRRPESFGRAVLEALSLGCPVVGYDHGGVGEVLRAAYPGGLVPLADSEALTEKVVELINDPKLVPCGHPYRLSGMVESTLEVYDQVVRDR